MQNEIKNPTSLFDESGNLKVQGYAKHNFFDYNKEKLTTSKLRLKEWDYYYVGNQHYAIALTIADNGYMGLLSISYLNFDTKEQITKSDMLGFTMGKLNLPRTSKSGDVSAQTKHGYLLFKHEDGTRHLRGYFNEFRGQEKLELDIVLDQEPDESITMLTPFFKEKHFYYNQKINCMRAQGTFRIGNDSFSFKGTESTGTLDWGRGVWTYENTWYWGSLSAFINGVPFGFNIGYGFGDTSKATENVIFYNGKAHKFTHIDFGIPTSEGKDDFLSKWTLKSEDQRLDMTFVPLFDRASDTNALLIRSNQHQVFGKYSGVAVLDDGTKIEFHDLLGFAEKVYNRW